MWLNLSIPLIIMNQSDKRKLEAFRVLCREQCQVADPSIWPTWDLPPNQIPQPPPDPPVSEPIVLPGPIYDPFVPVKFDEDISGFPRNTPFGTDPKDTLKTDFPYVAPPGSSNFLSGNFPPIDAPVPIDIPIDPPDDPPDVIPPPPPPPPSSECPSFHPDATIPGKMSQADTVRAITSYVNGKGFRHDPDGIPWMSPGQWSSWDGVTTINPCSTKAQLMAFIFPPPGGINSMRGLRDLFYQVKPFADNQNPTVAEIENWNIEVIRHFRKLLGFSQATHPVSNHKCTYLKAAWAEERARTDYWTSAYPGTLDSGAGPCTTPYSSNAHCGASFLPNPTDQIPYLCPANMTACGTSSSAEGVSNHNTDIPWAIKMSRIIGNYLNSDGIGAHTGPFVGREYFGSAWYMNGGSLTVRTKWSGNLAPTGCP